MTKRKWPDFETIFNLGGFENWPHFIRYYLENRMTEEGLQQIAPKIEEPKKACAFVGPQGQVIFYLDGVGCFADYNESDLWTRRPDLDIEAKQKIGEL